MTGDCKTCEIYSFIADYLEEILEPEGWQAIWIAEGSSLLVDVSAVESSPSVSNHILDFVTLFKCLSVKFI